MNEFGSNDEKVYGKIRSMREQDIEATYTELKNSLDLFDSELKCTIANLEAQGRVKETRNEVYDIID